MDKIIGFIQINCARVILLTDSSVKISDKIEYYISLIVKLAPIAFILEISSWWFEENRQFGNFMCIAIFINMIVGAVFHFRNNTFSWVQFLKRNMFMVFVVSVTYIMLEMLRYTAGDNLAGEIFKITIQISTLLYPTSRVLKNIFIMSNGKHPPHFIMKKLYDFEKNGDLKDFFNNKKMNDGNT